MARRLRTVGREFTDSAPIRLVFAAEVSASVDVVYHALAEDVASWPSWFTAVTSATPTDAGAGREVRLRGGIRFRETIVAAEPDACYAYRADQSNAPGLRALLEEWRLTPEGSGTRVQWTFAADGTGLFRLVLSLARAGMGRSFRDAVRRLDARLAATTP
ncbi:SRPBCC family protein [Streptomyces sp. NPDC102283]|uniref:SRPBCC family protein n=1 Tax=Streptomyces sp. NPDC102283 TaxID=3366155 RepID=UPI0037F5DF4A